MDSQAGVGSVDAFRDFRAAFVKLGDASRNALIAVDIEIRRMLDWLEKDQAAYWKNEIRRREEKLNEAKAALHRKRITATFGNAVSDSEEILMVRRAQAKLEHAENKLKEVKQWYLTVEQAVNEYRGPAQLFGSALDAGVPRGLSALDRMAEIIESYLAVGTPGSGGAAGGGAFASPSGAASAGSSAAAAQPTSAGPPSANEAKPSGDEVPS